MAADVAVGDAVSNGDAAGVAGGVEVSGGVGAPEGGWPAVGEAAGAGEEVATGDGDGPVTPGDGVAVAPHAASSTGTARTSVAATPATLDAPACATRRIDRRVRIHAC